MECHALMSAKTEGSKTTFAISQLLISLSWWISMVATCGMA